MINRFFKKFTETEDIPFLVWCWTLIVIVIILITLMILTPKYEHQKKWWYNGWVCFEDCLHLSN